MKSTRILLSLTLLCIGTHAIKAASSSNHTNKSESMWQQSQVAGYIYGKNDLTKMPTHEAIEMAKKTAKSYSTIAKEAKAAFHKKIVGDKSAKQYGLKDALEYVSKNSKNKAAEAFGIYSEADVRNFLKPLAKQGNGLQHVNQIIRDNNHVVVGTDTYFIKPSSAYRALERSLPKPSHVSTESILEAKKKRSPLMVLDQINTGNKKTIQRYRPACKEDLRVKLPSWKPIEDYVNTWVPCLEGEALHKDHNISADYEWKEEGTSWKPKEMNENTHGWILSSQSMKLEDKKNKETARKRLLKQVTAHTIINSKGETVYYPHNDNKPSQNNIDPRCNYQWKKNNKGKWQPKYTYASAVGFPSIAPKNIAAIHNSLENCGKKLKSLLNNPEKNKTLIESTRKQQKELRGCLNHHINFLETLKSKIVPTQNQEINKSIEALQKERDRLIAELGLSPAHAYYVQATIDAINHNLTETNEEITSDEIYNLAFGDKTKNMRTALTKACAEVIRNIPDSSRLISYKPTPVKDYYTKQKELELARKANAPEDVTNKIKDERNQFAQQNMQEAQDYINKLIVTNKLWKDTQEFEGKLHDLLYVIAELNAAQRTKETSTNAINTLDEQLKFARGETKQTSGSNNSISSSSSSSSSSSKKCSKNSKGKTSRRKTRRVIEHKKIK